MAMRCTTFILRVGTTATKARIWMDSDDEVIETDPSFSVDEAGNTAFTIVGWEGDFHYTLGLPRTLGVRPSPMGNVGTVPNLFQIEWKGPESWPNDPTTGAVRQVPMPTGVTFDPERPVGVDAQGNPAGKADTLNGTVGGTSPTFDRDISGEFDWTARIRFFQPDPTNPPAGWTDSACEGDFE